VNEFPHSEYWATAISALLNRHNLNADDLGVAAWTRGAVPGYYEACKFFERFPREEAIECLHAAGYPATFSLPVSSDDIKKRGVDNPLKAIFTIIDALPEDERLNVVDKLKRFYDLT